MAEDWVFERTGSFWKQPLYRRAWLNLKHWFRANGKFIKVLFNYQESVVENEITLLDAYYLCLSMEDARMGKTLSLKNHGSAPTARKEK